MQKILSFFLISFFGSCAFAFNGSATCYYEIYTREHFQKPVKTDPFKVDLTKTEDISTEHSALKRILRLRTKPGTVDGREFSHISFSQTYDGAHTGAVVPAKSGMYVLIVSKDESDILAAYLFCDVHIQTLSTTLMPLPKYRNIHCVNMRESALYQEIQYHWLSGRRYEGEAVRLESDKTTSNVSLGSAELYSIRENYLTIAGLGAVVEFERPQLPGVATSAEVRMNNPYYESSSWLCKVKQVGISSSDL